MQLSCGISFAQMCRFIVNTMGCPDSGPAHVVRISRFENLTVKRFALTESFAFEEASSRSEQSVNGGDSRIGRFLLVAGPIRTPHRVYDEAAHLRNEIPPGECIICWRRTDKSDRGIYSKRHAVQCVPRPRKKSRQADFEFPPR